MIAEPPLSAKLDDRMMCGPALNGLQDPSGVSEGTKRTIAHSIHNVVRIARAVAEVVLVAFAMHPCRFEESLIVIAGVNGFAIGVVYYQLLNWAVERLHVFR